VSLKTWAIGAGGAGAWVLGCLASSPLAAAAPPNGFPDINPLAPVNSLAYTTNNSIWTHTTIGFTTPTGVTSRA
jgi:hypothetical protein